VVRAHYIIERDDPTFMIIADVGTSSTSITNDAEAVVLELHKNGLGDRKLLYYDSEGKLGALVHDGKGKFLDFGIIIEDIAKKCTTCNCEPCVCGLTTW
jgi:hypothetical protein